MLKSVQNVEYLSGPSGRAARPQGRWSVVWASEADNKLLLAKDETIIQIPAKDVIKVADYDMTKVFDLMKKVRTFDDLEKLGLREATKNEEQQKGKRE